MNIKMQMQEKKKESQIQSTAVPESLSLLLTDGAEHFFYKTHFCSFLLQELAINGFKVGQHNIETDKQIKLSVHYDEPCLVLQYMFETKPSTIHVPGENEIHTTNQCFLYHAIKHDPILLGFEPGKHNIFQIQFPFSMFQKLNLQGSKPTRENVGKKQYFEGPININKKITFIIKQIISNLDKSKIDIFYLNHRCLDLLQRFVKEVTANQHLTNWINQKQPELQKFTEEIDANLSNPKLLRSMLPTLIKKMNVSLYQFDRISNKVFGMTMPAYVRSRRMEKAMKLLTQTSLLIGDIGVTVGFEEFSTFSRAFSKYFGNPPSFYRP